MIKYGLQTRMQLVHDISYNFDWLMSVNFINDIIKSIMVFIFQKGVKPLASKNSFTCLICKTFNQIVLVKYKTEQCQWLP